MKKTAAFLLFASLIFSCKKENPSLLTIQVVNLNYPVNTAFNVFETHYLTIENVPTNTLSLLAASNLDTAGIQNILPKAARIAALFGEADLDFIDAVSVRICPLGDTQPNCGQEVFYRDPTPFNNGSDIDLVPSNVDDIRWVIYPERVNVQLKLERLRDAPGTSFDINLAMEFAVR